MSYRAGLLLIMAYTVREMSEEQISSTLMRNTAKLAMAELSANKVRSNFKRAVVFLLLTSVLNRSTSVQLTSFSCTFKLY